MTVTIKPSKAYGSVSAPPSKSVSHRALICGALSEKSIIHNIAYSEDIKATINALKSLGANINIDGNTVTLGGLSPEFISSAEINCGESGSTLRFLIPICMLTDKEFTLTGALRLFERDLSVYEEIASKHNIKYLLNSDSLIVQGKLCKDIFCVRGDISSQFITGLMFALPNLDGNSEIRFITALQSKPYIDLTVKVLSDFGIKIDYSKNGYSISGRQSFNSTQYFIEGDYSNAAFLDAFNLIGGGVKVEGLYPDTMQGDSVYKEIFKTIKTGGTYDLSDCPDLAPVLFALAAHFSGARFKGTKRLKIKESDRAKSLKSELEKFGAEVFVSDNEVLIKNSKLHTPKVILNSHNDHRIVMALSILSSIYGGQIETAEAVNKSYPTFFDDIIKLGIEVEYK